MTKSKATKLSEVVAAEAHNLDVSTKYLGASAGLVGDVESVYQAMMPRLKLPDGDIDSSDELLAVVSILNEFMMCGMLLTKAALAAMRMYQGDALTHLRRAIESCAFAVRMGKHHDVSRVWAEGGTDKDGEDTRYRSYRKAFRTDDVYPSKKHTDYDPLLTELKGRFDFCSKPLHGSIFGMAGHFGTAVQDKDKAGILRVNLFDMPPDSLFSSFFYMLNTHKLILQLFGQVLEPYTTDFDIWKKEYLYVEGKLERHRQKWEPNVVAMSVARKKRHKVPN